MFLLLLLRQVVVYIQSFQFPDCPPLVRCPILCCCCCLLFFFQYKGSRIGCQITFDEADEIMRSIDSDQRDGVSMVEFQDWCARHEKEYLRRFAALRAAEDVLYRLWQHMGGQGLSVDDIFALFDTDQDGAISLQEMQRGLKTQVGGQFPAEDVEAMFNVLDYDHNGEISAEEWETLLVKHMHSTVLRIGTLEDIHSLQRRSSPTSAAKARKLFATPVPISAAGEGKVVASPAVQRIYKNYVKLKTALRKEQRAQERRDRIARRDAWLDEDAR